MTFELEKHESDVAICSLKQYFATELDMALNDLQARLLLDYILREFGPLAYNRGVQDAERFMRARRGSAGRVLRAAAGRDMVRLNDRL
jgi:uncharacterized protein (DUF2164 family)